MASEQSVRVRTKKLPEDVEPAAGADPQGSHATRAATPEDAVEAARDPAAALERARRILDRYIKDDESLTDSLIADRRAEASRE